jgi:hypothetical protein
MNILYKIRGWLAFGWALAFCLVACCLAVSFTYAPLVKAAGFNLPMMQITTLFASLMVALLLPGLVSLYFPNIMRNHIDMYAAKREYQHKIRLYNEAINKLQNAAVAKALQPFPREKQIAIIQALLNERKEAGMHISATEIMKHFIRKKKNNELPDTYRT